MKRNQIGVERIKLPIGSEDHPHPVERVRRLGSNNPVKRNLTTNQKYEESDNRPQCLLPEWNLKNISVVELINQWDITLRSGAATSGKMHITGLMRCKNLMLMISNFHATQQRKSSLQITLFSGGNEHVAGSNLCGAADLSQLGTLPRTILCGWQAVSTSRHSEKVASRKATIISSHPKRPQSPIISGQSHSNQG